jgi:hypothetical protein
MTKFVLRENSGNLFKADKNTPEDRDYRGELNVEGREFWVSAWIKQERKIHVVCHQAERCGLQA